MVVHQHLVNGYNYMHDKVLLLSQVELIPKRHLLPKPWCVLCFLYEDVLLMYAKIFIHNYIIYFLNVMLFNIIHTITTNERG